MSVAAITGITGQDGSYLCELLLEKGYEVHGLVRRSSSTARARLDQLFYNSELYNRRLFLHYSDLEDVTTMRRILVRVQPDELYHLAGQSHVGVSFEIPESTCQFTAMGTLKLLEIVRDLSKRPRFLHISSSEIFGRAQQWPQNESTAMRPVTPYGVAKTFATQMVQVYRNAFDLFACNAICYNHESPRRGESFVTRKIARGVAAIVAGTGEQIRLGDLSAKRDWGFAPEFVEGMWRMLQQPTSDDYILATGHAFSVEQFLVAAFESVGLDWQKHVAHDPRMVRPSDVSMLVGDPSKANRVLSWQAQTLAPQLAELMVRAELEQMKS